MKCAVWSDSQYEKLILSNPAHHQLGRRGEVGERSWELNNRNWRRLSSLILQFQLLYTFTKYSLTWYWYPPASGGSVLTEPHCWLWSPRPGHWCPPRLSVVERGWCWMPAGNRKTCFYKSYSHLTMGNIKITFCQEVNYILRRLEKCKQ